MNSKLQFHLDGEWIDLRPFEPSINTQQYSELEQTAMRAAVADFIKAHNCTVTDVVINRLIFDDKIQYIVAFK